MEPDELRKLIAEVQYRRMEPDAVEVKAARGGTPKVFDSLSAFANRPGGGIILFGLDERQGFELVAEATLNDLDSSLLDDYLNLTCAAATFGSGCSPTGWRCRAPVVCSAT